MTEPPPMARPRTTTAERLELNRAVERVTVLEGLNAKLSEIDRVWGELNTSYERGDLSIETIARAQLLTSRATLEIIVMLMGEVMRR
jgi:hypothetical protein